MDAPQASRNGTVSERFVFDLGIAPKPSWSVEEIDHQLRDRVGELVESISGKQGVCRGNEIRIGTKGGLKADIKGPNKGRVTAFDGDGKGKTPLQFIQSEIGCSFPDAIDWAANWLGMSPDYKPDPEVERLRREKRERDKREAASKDEEEKAQRIGKAVSIFNSTVDAAGSPVELYLRARGITVNFPPDIRYLPGGQYDAMVAVARDSVGIVKAVQRVFILEGKKAPIDTPKRTNGDMNGACVRLPACWGDELVLAEGPETGLSVWQAWGRETWIALGSIAKLVDAVPLDKIVVVARDADAPGSPADEALMKAVAQMMERGVSVRIASPPIPTKKGYDFNDALMDYGNDAVANALGNQIKPRYPAQVSFEKSDQHIYSGYASACWAYWRGKAEYASWVAAKAA